MKVFLTGAAGFIGKAVVAELAKRNHEVVGLVRSEEKGKAIEKLGGRYVIGDLLKEGPWTDEVKSSYRIISLTWPVKFHDRANLDTMVECNLKHARAVTNLIKAAKHGEARSILATYDTLCLGDKSDKWIEEPGKLAPVGFGRVIANAYDEIMRASVDAGIPLVNVFPGRAYGNGGWFAYMVERIQKGTWKLAGKGDNYMPLIHVEDLAWAFAEATERLTHDASFAIADGMSNTQAEFTNYVADLLGAARPQPMDFHEFAEIEGIMLAESLATSARVSNVKAEKLLDFNPVYADFHEGVFAALKALGYDVMHAKEKAA